MKQGTRVVPERQEMSETSFPDGSRGKESACNVGDVGQSVGWEDPLEKGAAKHSSILAWRIPWTEKPGRLQFMGSQRARQDGQLSLSAP